MKITSRASDYALLLLIYLARLPNKATVSVRQAARDLGLSLRFLANIANKLSIARILISHRGIGGGIHLGRTPQKITIKEVIEAVDGPVQTMFCQNTDEICNWENHCQMKHFWDDMQGVVIHKLNETTIAHLSCPVKPPPFGRGREAGIYV